MRLACMTASFVLFLVPGLFSTPAPAQSIEERLAGLETDVQRILDALDMRSARTPTPKPPTEEFILKTLRDSYTALNQGGKYTFTPLKRCCHALDAPGPTWDAHVKAIGAFTGNTWPVKISITGHCQKAFSTEKLSVSCEQEFFIGQDDYGTWKIKDREW